MTAESEDGVIMGVRHRELPMEAVQFHPESILTLEGNCGLRLMENVVAQQALTGVVRTLIDSIRNKGNARMQFDLSDIIFLVVVLSIAILLINNGGGGGFRARVPVSR